MLKRDVEREQLEWVFRLSSGELASRPWAGNKYWYDGIPKYAGDDFVQDEGALYRTAVVKTDPEASRYDMPDEIEEEGGRYVLKNIYTSSGATECPGHYDVDNAGMVVRERCLLCEADVGEKHGEIRLGEGWVEAVYMFERELDDEEN